MSKADAIADLLASDWTARGRYQTLRGDLAPNDLTEAYEAQAAVQARHLQNRGPISGRKIALSSKAMQNMVGIDRPVAGVFFANDILRSPATVKLDSFRHMGLEYELAFQLGADVPPSTGHTSASVRSLIESVSPAFELIEDRNADYATIDILTLVADNAWCGGVVLGSPIPEWQSLDLANLPSVLHQEGLAAEDGNTGAADPLTSLAWVLNHFGARGTVVGKGEHIITGSVLRTRFPEVGDVFRYEISGHAEVSLTLV